MSVLVQYVVQPHTTCTTPPSGDKLPGFYKQLIFVITLVTQNVTVHIRLKDERAQVRNVHNNKFYPPPHL